VSALTWRDAAMQHAKQQDPNESCGLLVELESDAVIYWPCRNMANSGEEFAMDPLDYAAAEDSGTVLAIIHSHPGGSIEPSRLDIRGIQLSGLSWFIIDPRTEQWSDEYHPSVWAASEVHRAASIQGSN